MLKLKRYVCMKRILRKNAKLKKKKRKKERETSG